MDFIYLNRACPKDSFSHPSINKLVDVSDGHKVLSFMDAFSSYNQIMIDPTNQEKTTFIILLQSDIIQTVERGFHLLMTGEYSLRG